MTTTPQDDASTYGQILDLNSQIISAVRLQVENMELIRDTFLLQASRCEEIIKALVLTSVETTETIGDTLLAEFGFSLSELKQASEREEDGED